MNKIFSNIQIKLLSIIIAIVVWVILKNIMNPLVDSFVNVPVNIINEDYVLSQNKTYVVLDNRMVRVNYLVKTDYQTQIRQSDFDVYVDLKNIDNTNMLQIVATPNANIENYVSNVSVSPNTLHVELDDVARKEFEVRFDIKGDIDKGHSVGNVILSPNVVYVTGSNVAVGNIESVSIEIPINNNEEMFSGIARVRLFNKEGHNLPIDGVSLSAEEINYSVVMNTQSSVELNVLTEGELEKEYNFEGVTINPKTIVVNGPKSVLQNLYTIDLPAIDIEGLTENKEITYRTQDILPIGITSNTQSITVTVEISGNRNLNNGRGAAAVIGPRVEESTANENINETLENTENAN